MNKRVRELFSLFGHFVLALVLSVVTVLIDLGAVASFQRGHYVCGIGAALCVFLTGNAAGKALGKVLE